jgi:uncharacterized protein YbaR (Trm112 family)
MRVREALGEAFDKQIPVLESLADGEPTVRTRVTLASLLPNVACPNCSGQLDPASERERDREIEVMTGASPKDRTLAIEVMARYGLAHESTASVTVVAILLPGMIAFTVVRPTGSSRIVAFATRSLGWIVFF